MLNLHGSKFLIFFLFCYVSFSAKKVKTNKDLQNCIFSAQPFDTLIITKGFYICDSLLVNKPLTIIGENYPTFSGNNKNQILVISANQVSVSKIKFANSGVSFLHDNSAIKLDGVKDCKITENIFDDNFFSIYLAKSQNCLIEHNRIIAYNKRQTLSGNGIHLWYCRNITIKNNFIQGHRDGIYLEFVRNSKIISNRSKNNLRYGLHFMFSDSCEYMKNIFEKNIAGVAVMYSKKVEMTENQFLNNWGSSSYGLLLKDISESNIRMNVFKKNTNGIYFEACGKTNIVQNKFIENGWALRLMANSMDNVFRFNSFSSNTFDISTNSKNNYNLFENNYWSEYSGYDLNKDGIGDIPFRPVKLFSVVSEKNRPTLILLNSILIKILDIAEKIFPSITPENLIDNKPLMRPTYDKV